MNPNRVAQEGSEVVGRGEARNHPAAQLCLRSHHILNCLNNANTYYSYLENTKQKYIGDRRLDGPY